MTTNYGERPGLEPRESDADALARVRMMLDEANAGYLRVCVERNGLRRELDAERAAHRETLEALEECASALEAVAREQAPHPGALNPDLWNPAQTARAAIAAASGEVKP